MIESLLLAITRVTTVLNKKETTNATGFFFERDARMYLERFIHGEIYKARPEVKAVVHNHAAAIIPFGASNVPLRPIYHMAGFVGRGVPIFEIRKVAGDTDMLVKTPALGGDITYLDAGEAA